MNWLLPVQKLGAPAALSAQKPVSSWKNAFVPPPRSSTPLKPMREPPVTPDETRIDLPAAAPLSMTRPRSTLP